MAGWAAGGRVAGEETGGCAELWDCPKPEVAKNVAVHNVIADKTIANDKTARHRIAHIWIVRRTHGTPRSGTHRTTRETIEIALT